MTDKPTRRPRHHNLTVSPETISKIRAGDQTLTIKRRPFAKGDSVSLFEATRTPEGSPAMTGNVWQATIGALVMEEGSAVIGLENLHFHNHTE